MVPRLTITPFNDEITSRCVFVIAIVIAKWWLNGFFSFHDDQFPASGTDFSLCDDQKTADRWVSKWPPAVQNGSPLCLGRTPHITGTRTWPPYGGSSLDAEVFRPLERIEPVFSAFQWVFYFRLMTISFYSKVVWFLQSQVQMFKAHNMWNFANSITSSAWCGRSKGNRFARVNMVTET